MWFDRMDRLSLRLAVGITVVVVGLLAAGLSLLSVRHAEATVEARRRAAEMQNRILETSLRHQMLEKDRGFINAILSEIAGQPEVRSAMILDHEGKIRFAGNPALVGQTIPRDSPACLVCHSKEPGQRERWTVLGDGNDQVLRSVQPIENRPECYECHDSKSRMNGMLVLDLSLSEVEAQVARDRKWMTAATAALALLLIAGIGVLMRRLILSRLARLGRTARAIASGRLHERAEVQGDDSITRLAKDFNDMTDSMVGLVTQVEAQQAQLSNVMNSLDDGLVVLNQEFQVIASNHAWSRRCALLPEEARGKRCRDAIRGRLPCGTGDAACPSARCFSTGDVQRALFHVGEENGSVERFEEVSASPVFDDDGRVVQVVEIWRDISERVKEESRLAEFEQLNSLGVLASGFSHEMNTPLASTLTCAEAILGRLEEDASRDEIRPIAETIRREVLRCRRITDQFLRFARGVPPSPEPVDLKSVIPSVVSLVSPTARQSGISVRVEGDEEIPFVTANAETLQHVFLNLLVNAVQAFDSKGGNVIIGCHVGDDVRVRVRDNGRGIPLEAQKHLFQPFQTGRKGGTGIGLFLSRTFMRRFGGDVRLVESVLGQGSCFEVSLARVREDAR